MSSYSFQLMNRLAGGSARAANQQCTLPKPALESYPRITGVSTRGVALGGLNDAAISQNQAIGVKAVQVSSTRAAVLIPGVIMILVVVDIPAVVHQPSRWAKIGGPLVADGIFLLCFSSVTCVSHPVILSPIPITAYPKLPDHKTAQVGLALQTTSDLRLQTPIYGRA
ncbi:uncharacterized protein B0J16DRAFT_321865 [Fusarium flagelliforme]|uniref:uncharacterized protein n=1 Tax=Fusarium flagelliforme TaxID=2675880 RepID=UPI001E8DAB3E|nr:uncharacterized protein B0J16DRAFT_321865 [Fusarium flagelliforme]KAH7183120.1 hypothetical protein B0J16DRAFT_321865 [Fusarium flagelliforme]